MIQTSSAVMCLDSGVWIKALVAEEPAELGVAAVRLIEHTLARALLVASAFAWAEVGSTLRKQVRRGLITPSEAVAAWDQFLGFPIEYVDDLAVRTRAWFIAQGASLPTLYDAAFLACTEVVAARTGLVPEFWTVYEALLPDLESACPSYVHLLTSTNVP